MGMVRGGVNSALSNFLLICASQLSAISRLGPVAQDDKDAISRGIVECPDGAWARGLTWTNPGRMLTWSFWVCDVALVQAYRPTLIQALAWVHEQPLDPVAANMVWLVCS